MTCRHEDWSTLAPIGVQPCIAAGERFADYDIELANCPLCRSTVSRRVPAGDERPVVPDLRIDAIVEQQEAQRRSFAFGNCAIDNPLVTRRMVDEAAARLNGGSEKAGTG